ncbi:MAG: Fic family protein, partial [Pseudomonadota bacterium]
MYIYLLKGWPNFTWDKQKLTDLLARLRYSQGCLLGKMSSLGFNLQEESTLQTLTQDVIKTSEIEGENLNKEQVRSSIAKRLGIAINEPVIISSRNVEGIVEIMLDATKNYNNILTNERLFSWHAALFPTGRSGLQKITVGNWRGKSSGAMQIVSGPYGREKIHYEALTYDRIKIEMQHFIDWINLESEIDPVIKAAIAHFWFVTIHPFDDGNGRIARAIADMLLARSENTSKRFYSMSSQIQNERNSYYNVLEKSQKWSLDISIWIEWFLNCLNSAIAQSDEILFAIIIKAKFWENHLEEYFNHRQRLIINLLLDGNFIGKLNSSKWAKITKCSQDTALRDINSLLEQGIL